MEIELLELKRQILIDYQLLKVSTQAMKFLLNHSSEIPCELHSDLHSLIAMDMGGEFVLPQKECMQSIDKLLTR
jgi:hypothetical protein